MCQMRSRECLSLYEEVAEALKYTHKISEEIKTTPKELWEFKNNAARLTATYWDVASKKQ